MKPHWTDGFSEDLKKTLRKEKMRPEDSKFKAVYCDIVHRCNMECANCYLPFREYADLDTDKVINFIKRFKVKTEFRFIGV